MIQYVEQISSASVLLRNILVEISYNQYFYNFVMVDHTFCLLQKQGLQIARDGLVNLKYRSELETIAILNDLEPGDTLFTRFIRMPMVVNSTLQRRKTSIS